MCNTISSENNWEAFSMTAKKCSLLCSILVIFIHSYNVTVYNVSSNSIVFWLEEIVSQCISRGAVPFFFISSAFFLFQKEKPILLVYKSRFKSLLIPYLLWNTIYMLAFTVLNKLSLTDTGIDQLNVSNILEGILLYKYNYTYWFMFYLIIFTFLYPIIKQLICRNKLVCVLVLLVLLTVYLSGIFSHRFLEFFICYYLGAMLGFYYKGNVEKIAAIKSIHKLYLIIVLSLITVALFIASNIYSVNLALIRNLVMVLLLFLVSSFQKLKIPALVLGFSFMIYSIHPIILEMIEKIIYIIFPHNTLWAITDYIIAPVATAFIIVAVCVLLKKWFPAFYRLLNGNRK